MALGDSSDVSVGNNSPEVEAGQNQDGSLEVNTNKFENSDIENSLEIAPKGSLWEKLEIENYNNYILWPSISLAKGESITLTYTHDAPDKSPKLHLLGPLALMRLNDQTPITNDHSNPNDQLTNPSAPADTESLDIGYWLLGITSSEVLWTEPRPWQLAADGLKNAELLVKKGDGQDYKDGDIISALNSKRILDVHAQNITNPKFQDKNKHGLREPGSTLEDYLLNTKEFKFQRLSKTAIKKINLQTREETVISDVPNADGEQMDVPTYIARRLRHDRHQIFGTPGQEYWFGGRTITTDVSIDKVWEQIEAKTSHQKKDYKTYPFTPHERKKFKVIKIGDLTDKEVGNLTAPELDDNGETVKQRRYKIDLSNPNNPKLKKKAKPEKVAMFTPGVRTGEENTSEVRAGVTSNEAGITSDVSRSDSSEVSPGSGTNSPGMVVGLVHRLLGIKTAHAATVTTSIGTRAAENVDITGVSGTGPYTVTLSGATTNTANGDVLNDEAGTPNEYLVTAGAGAGTDTLTVRDVNGVGSGPDSSGTSQATTTRKYSSITNWEADLDNGTTSALYAASDDAVGEVYNDATYDESVTIDGGGTVGLSSIKLTVPSAERHDGTAGSGTRIVRTANGEIIRIARTDTTVEWLETDGNENGNNSDKTGIFTVASDESSTVTTTIANTIAHGHVSTNASCYAYGNTSDGRSIRVINALAYDMNTNEGTGTPAGGVYSKDNLDEIFNVTIHDITRSDGTSTGEIYGISVTNTASIKNVIVTNTADEAGTLADVADFHFGDVNADSETNLSSDATADDAGGAGHIINAVTADQFVSTVDGSEDLHLKSGADAIDAGTDLSTTPTGVNYDIDNRDRDAEEDTWDIGADEFVAAAGFGGLLTQNDWRWYVDDDTENITNPWGDPNIAENTSLAVVPATNDPPESSDELRLRMNIGVSGDTLSADEKQFKLQYSQSNSCTTASSWTDVGAGGGDSIWRYAESSVSDQSSLTEAKLSTTNILQSYAKSSSTIANPNSVSDGQNMEWDFHIQHNGATAAATYCFRLVESDGTELDTYNADSYAKLETKPGTTNIMSHGNVFVDGVEKGATFTN